MKTYNVNKTILMVLVSLFGMMASSGASDRVGLIVAQFDGGTLAKNVQAVFHLMLWQTLRKGPVPKPQINFGSGIIEWAEYGLDSQSHSAAEQLARENGVQMTLWGNILSYGDGVVVQTNLSIPQYDDEREKKPELWVVSLRVSGQNYRIEADIPHRYYEFAPIILDNEVVRKYSSPGALKVYKDKNLTPPSIGILGDTFRAIRHEGDRVYVMSEDMQPGWVHLPRLSSQRNEVIDFSGGLIRVYRGDWEGAFDLMKKVIRNEKAPTTLKVDAFLFQALAKTRQGKSPDEELSKARELSPYSSVVVIYDIMSDLEMLSRALQGSNENNSISEAARNHARQIETKIRENRYLFPENDVWLKSILEVTEKIR